ncbi:MAG TPA: bifunctional diguanylate cyclase/phosphodiesterase [Candidatus Dormibacteraeota bacterium]
MSPPADWVGDIVRRSQREATALPAPFRRAGLAFRLVPLLIAGVATVALQVGPNLVLTNQVTFGVLGFTLVLLVVAFFVPWQRLPRYLQSVPPLLANLMVMVVAISTAGTESSYTPLLLLPIIWLALYCSWLELTAGVLMIAAGSLLPALLTNASGVVIMLNLVYAGMTALIGYSVYAVVARMRGLVIDIRVVGHILGELDPMSDPGEAREALCEGARQASQAEVGLLLELQPDGGLHCSAASPHPVDLRVEPHAPDRPAAEMHPALLALASAEPVLTREGAFLPLDRGLQRSVLWQPVMREGRPAAVLCVAWAWVIHQLANRETMAAALFALEAAVVINRAELVEELQRKVRTDSLTSVWNRRAWDEELPRYLARAARANHPLCVAALDLDNFKAYNDDWGHDRGDRLLRDVATAWQLAVREVDFLARLGGDEFAVCLPDCNLEGASIVMARMMAAVPEGQAGSGGIAQCDGAETADQLFARADAALYDSKRGSRGEVVVAEAGASPGLRRWTDVVSQILHDHSITPVYQPICDLATREVIGYEALARPAGEAASASVEGLFAAAHRMGSWRDLDWLCRREAAGGARELPQGSTVFINVGVRALLDPVHDVDQMLLLMRWAQVAPTTVVLEISEREPVNDLHRFKEVLKIYRGEGFRFALDDVGEGHSTFEVLAAAEPEYIKLARYLTLESAMGGRRAMVRALVEFGLSGGSELIAEGIETDSQLESMRSMGVGFGQGWLLGRPMRMGMPHASQVAPTAAG